MEKKIAAVLMILFSALWANDSLYQVLEMAEGAGKVLAYQELANYYYSIDKEKSDSLNRVSLKYARDFGDDKIVADAIYDYGYLNYRRGFNDTALVYVNQALKKYEAIADTAGIGKSYNRLGNIYWHLEKQMEALKYVQKAIEFLKFSQDHREYGIALNSLANMYRSWGDYIKAIDLLVEANKQYEIAGFEEGIAWLNFSMTLLYKRLGNYEAALASIHKSLDIYEDMARKSSDSSGILISYGQLGDIYRIQKDFDKALYYQKEAFRMRTKTGSPVIIADAHATLGNLYLDMEQLESAEFHLKEALQLRLNNNAINGLPTIYYNLGKTHFLKGDGDLSKKMLQDGLEAAVKLKDRRPESDILYLLAKMKKEEGDYSTALDYFHRYVAVKDTLFNADVTERIAALQVQYEIEEQNRENQRLQQENLIKKLEVERSVTLRNFLFLLILFFLSMVAGVLILYRQKMKDNKILIEKNQQISEAHDILQKEISERRKMEQEREKLIAELQESLNSIKTLRGLIPICANCKKIRDDEGYYIQVEEYISNHSHAVFSHGICPDCMARLYPEMNDEGK
jgi:tetratricopeptide (TPR) repeat protein